MGSRHAARRVEDLHFPLLENALDFLASAVEHLGDSSNRSLKYAVLHLAAGAELLVKERLRREGWQLLFEDPDRADEAKFDAGAFRSIAPEEALKRLVDIGVEIPQHHQDTLALLRAKRNRIQHFAVIDTKASAEVVTARALGFALDFIAAETEDAEADPAVAGYIDELRAAVVELDAFVRERWNEIRETVENAQTAVISCSACGECAALIDHGARCVFCGYALGAEDTAHDYAGRVVGVTRYEAETDGGDYPVSLCPSCDQDTLVDCLASEVPRWFCATCGQAWEDGDLDSCMICGRFHAGDMSVCSDCFEDRVRAE